MSYKFALKVLEKSPNDACGLPQYIKGDQGDA